MVSTWQYVSSGCTGNYSWTTAPYADCVGSIKKSCQRDNSDRVRKEHYALELGGRGSSTFGQVRPDSEGGGDGYCLYNHRSSHHASRLSRGIRPGRKGSCSCIGTPQKQGEMNNLSIFRCTLIPVSMFV